MTIIITGYLSTQSHNSELSAGLLNSVTIARDNGRFLYLVDSFHFKKKQSRIDMFESLKCLLHSWWGTRTGKEALFRTSPKLTPCSCCVSSNSVWSFSTLKLRHLSAWPIPPNIFETDVLDTQVIIGIKRCNHRSKSIQQTNPLWFSLPCQADICDISRTADGLSKTKRIAIYSGYSGDPQIVLIPATTFGMIGQYHFIKSIHSCFHQWFDVA